MIPAIKVEDGEIITKPGIYEMSMRWYHSQCCDGPSFSSSPIRTAWDESPADVFDTFELNPNRRELTKEELERPHFSLGRAAHHLFFLGEAGFGDEFVIRPEIWKDWRTNDSKSWKATMIEAGLTIITDTELKHIHGMRQSLGRHPMVKAGILDGAVERSLIYRDPVTKIWVKSRPDNMTTDSGDYSDLKTTESTTDAAIDRALKKFSYHMQAAVVGRASAEVTGQPMETFSFVWAQKKPPYSVRVTQASSADLALGSEQLDATLRILRRCLDTGVWPGPGGVQQDAEVRGLDDWTAKRIRARLDLLKAMEDPLAQVALPPATPVDDDEDEDGDDAEEQNYGA